MRNPDPPVKLLEITNCWVRTFTQAQLERANWLVAEYGEAFKKKYGSPLCMLSSHSAFRLTFPYAVGWEFIDSAEDWVRTGKGKMPAPGDFPALQPA